ncbi:MAG: hypothetical protein DWI02_09830 [Planctomycetota bacterium]|nr:MAG: hypothetical protein DWI02_09830 [Planctomycetota bacterium]
MSLLSALDSIKKALRCNLRTCVLFVTSHPKAAYLSPIIEIVIFRTSIAMDLRDRRSGVNNNMETKNLEESCLPEPSKIVVDDRDSSNGRQIAVLRYGFDGQSVSFHGSYQFEAGRPFLRSTTDLP